MSRKGESIYKRKDGRWEARFFKEVNETGEKQLASVYAKSYMEVKNKRTAIIQKLAAEKSNLPRSSLLLSELMQMWLDFNKSRIALSSYQKYECLIRNHIQPHIGKLKISQLTNTTLKDFENELLKDGSLKQAKGLSARSVNSILTVIGSALKWSSETFGTPVVKIPFLREPHFSPQILSKSDQLLLEKFCKQHQNVYTYGILISLYTGMRLGEICALRWEDIDNDTIFVHCSMQRMKTKSGRWEIMISEPKTENSRRFIPIPDCLIHFIKENRENSGFVLKQDNGKFIEPRLMQKKMLDIFKKSNVCIRNFHALRHTFATRLIDCGSDPKTVSELLGHSTVQITLNKYVHPSFDMKKSAIDKVSMQSSEFVCGQVCGI